MCGIIGSSQGTFKSFELRGEGIVEVKLKPLKLDWRLEEAGKLGFEHYTLKEIFEQPLSLAESSFPIRVPESSLYTARGP